MTDESCGQTSLPTQASPKTSEFIPATEFAIPNPHQEMHAYTDSHYFFGTNNLISSVHQIQGVQDNVLAFSSIANKSLPALKID